MEQAFKNVDVYLGAMAGVDAKLLTPACGCLCRTLCRPISAWAAAGTSKPSGSASCPEWDWSSKGVEPLVQGVSLENSEEESLPCGWSSKQRRLQMAVRQISMFTAALGGETPYIVLAFDNSVTDTEIQNNLTVAKDDGSSIPINWIANDGDID